MADHCNDRRTHSKSNAGREAQLKLTREGTPRVNELIIDREHACKDPKLRRVSSHISSASAAPKGILSRRKSICSITHTALVSRTRAASSGTARNNLQTSNTKTEGWKQNHCQDYSSVPSRYLKYTESSKFMKQVHEQRERRRRLESANAENSLQRQRASRMLERQCKQSCIKEQLRKLQYDRDLHDYKSSSLIMEKRKELAQIFTATLREANSVNGTTSASTASTDMTVEYEGSGSSDNENYSYFLDLELSSISSSTSHDEYDSSHISEPFFCL